MATSVAEAGGEVQWGVIGTMEEVPAGWSMETLMHIEAEGVNAAVLHWGVALLQAYGKKRSTALTEISTSHVGFATDNGAYYYYHTEPNTTYQQTMYDAQTYWESLDVPFRYVWFDSCQCSRTHRAPTHARTDIRAYQTHSAQQS